MIVKKIEADSMSSALKRAKELFGNETKIHRTTSLQNGRFQIVASAKELLPKPLEKKLPTKETFLEGENFAEEFVSSSDSVLDIKNDISDMKDFINGTLKDVIKSNEESSWGIEAKLHPAQPTILAMLLSNGISASDAKELSLNLPRNIAFAKKTVIDRLLSKVSLTTSVAKGIHCFVGPSGSGKTSSMIKIAISLMQERNSVCFVLGASSEHGSYEKLEATATILGIDMYSKNKDVPRGVYDYVFIDSASKKAILSPKTYNHLIIAASSSELIYKKYIDSGMKIDSVIFTKVDELEQIGFPILLTHKLKSKLIFMNNSNDLTTPLISPTKSKIISMIQTNEDTSASIVSNIAQEAE